MENWTVKKLHACMTAHKLHFFPPVRCMYGKFCSNVPTEFSQLAGFALCCVTGNAIVLTFINHSS